MRKKTQAQKKLSGTTRPDRAKRKTPKVVTVNKIPPPKSYLTATGKKVYKELCEHMIKHNSLCTIDALYLSTVAHAFDQYAKLAANLQGVDDMIQIFENGTRQISPEVTALKHFDTKIEKACINLGLHMAARDKIKAFATEENQNEKTDPIEAMMTSLKGRTASK